jgi:hypothetical protein
MKRKNERRPRAKRIKAMVEYWQATTRGFSVRQLKARAKVYISAEKGK